jgi:hypothetical protein
MARAMISLPVPLSPVMSTVMEVGATWRTLSTSCWKDSDLPMSSNLSDIRTRNGFLIISPMDASQAGFQARDRPGRFRGLLLAFPLFLGVLARCFFRRT